MSVGNVLRDRIPRNWSNRHRDAIESVLAAIDDLAARRGALDRDVDLSAPGRAKRLKAFAAEKIARDYAAGDRMRQAWRSEAAAARASLINKAAIADALGGEIRAVLRGMPHHERVAMVLDAQTDQRVIAAVLSAPGFLSGVPDDVRGHVETAYLERFHAADLATLADHDAAINMIETTLNALRGPLQDAVQVSQHQFEQWLADTVQVSPEELQHERWRQAANEIDARNLPFLERNAALAAARAEIFGAAAA